MRIVTVVGPTAVGKTALAVRIARKISGEIVSADSRQIYKYLTIGTAKPTHHERTLVDFHLIDFVEPDASYSCGQFARDAVTKIQEILSRGHVPIVCGGTGLYIRALFNPLHKLPESDPVLKKKLTAALQKHGIDHLYRRLRAVDPVWAEKISPHDKQRIMRGLEVYELTTIPLSTLLTKRRRKPRYSPLYIGLELPRQELYECIDRRFDAMIEQGLIDEVKSLLMRGYCPESNALRTIGYHEIIEYLNGHLPLSDALEKAKQRTRNFARRQLTWFGTMSAVKWYNPTEPNAIETIIKTVFTLLEKQS